MLTLHEWLTYTLISPAPLLSYINFYIHTLLFVYSGCLGVTPKNAVISSAGNVVYDDSELPVYHIYYDLKPLELLDPLLLY